VRAALALDWHLAESGRRRAKVKTSKIDIGAGFAQNPKRADNEKNEI